MNADRSQAAPNFAILLDAIDEVESGGFDVVELVANETRRCIAVYDVGDQVRAAMETLGKRVTDAQYDAVMGAYIMDEECKTHDAATTGKHLLAVFYK